MSSELSGYLATVEDILEPYLDAAWRQFVQDSRKMGFPLPKTEGRAHIFVRALQYYEQQPDFNDEESDSLVYFNMLDDNLSEIVMKRNPGYDQYGLESKERDQFYKILENYERLTK